MAACTEKQYNLRNFVAAALDVRRLDALMHLLLNAPWWTLAFGTLVQLVLFLRWLYRRIRNDEMTRVFVEDMATHHLPHIYDLLLKICEEQGIDHTRPPRIRWIDLTGPSH
jgi:hypothetical protein